MTETIRKRYRLSPEGNVLAMWSLILGVAGFCIPLAGGVGAVVLGVLGLIRARRTMNGQPAAVAGIILGAISIVGWVAGWAIVHAFTAPAR
jgi:uncharacterized protein DUF4190